MVLNKSSCCLSACGIDFALEGRLAEATNCRQILLRDLLLIFLLKDLLLLVFIILALGCSGLPRKTRFAVYLQKICASKDSVSRLPGFWMGPRNVVSSVHIKRRASCRPSPYAGRAFHSRGTAIDRIK